MWKAPSTCIRGGRPGAALLVAAAAAALAGTAAAGVDRKRPFNPSYVTVSQATSASLTLSWRRSTDSGKRVAGYRLYVNGAFVAAAESTSYTFVNLSCGRSYTLGVQSYDRAGNSSTVVTVVASTKACPDRTPPTAPAEVTQTGVTRSSISLSWTPSADAGGVARYNLYRDGTAVGTTQATSYTFSGLECGRSYTFMVEAVDAAGNVSPAAAVLASTSPCPDTLAPVAPTFLVQTAVTTSTIGLSWAVSMDDVGLAGYGIYVNGVRASTTTLTSYTVANLSCGKTYTLGVDAFDAAGNRSSQTSVIAATGACPLVTPEQTLTFTPAADARVEETYPSSNFGTSFLRVDGGADPRVESSLRFVVPSASGTITGATLRLYATTDTVQGPSVYAASGGWTEGGVTWSTRASRATDPSAGAGAIATGTWLDYDVGAVVRSGGTYNFTLATSSSDGVNFDSREGNQAPRLVLRTTGGSADTQAPTSPGGLRQTGATAGSVSVTWTASTDNVTVAGYGVYVNGNKVGSTSGTTYTATGLSCGTSSTLALDAYDTAGNRSPRVSISTTTSACSSGGTGTGWPANPFPRGSVYNPGQPIPSNVAVHPNSANIVNFLVSTTTSGFKFVCCNWSVAIGEAESTHKVYQVVDDSYHGSGNINRFGGVPLKAGTRWDPSGDGHLTILDYANGREYSFWQASYNASTDVWSTTCGQATTFAELNIPSNYCGANTANMPGSAGLIAPEEIQGGVINHPLVFAAAAIYGDGNDHVCPAGYGWGETSNTNAPRAGHWFQMDPTLDVNALAIPTWQKTIVRALQQYGAFVRDQSANDTTFFGENPLNRATAPSWGSLGINGNQVLSSAIPWSRMRVLAPPC
jgi:chitodextrinase